MKNQVQLIISAIFMVLAGLTSYGQVKIGKDIIGFHHLGLGEATSLSADGNTVAIGCWSPNSYNPNNDLAANGIYGNNGSVRVYAKKSSSNTGVIWEQVGDFIFPEILDNGQPGQRSGRAIRLSDNGSILAIGTRGNHTDAGYVRVFKKTADASSPGGFKWVKIGNDIEGTQAGGESGFDVSLSEDGNVVAIGAPFFDVKDLSNAGQVRVYKRDAFDNWVQLGEDIEGHKKGERLGASVSISDDGNTLAMAALHLGPAYRNKYGHISYDSEGLITKVYQNVNDDWVKVGDFMGDEGTISRDERGGYVRLTGDGNTLAITSWADGSVRVYKRDANDNWTLKGNELRGSFGYGIALSDDANILAVGVPSSGLGNFLPYTGEVRIYKYRPNNTWEVVTGFNGEHKWHELGSSNSLSLSKDGSVLAMGASDYGFDNTTGKNLLQGRARMYNIGVSGVSIQGAPAAVNTTDPFDVTFKFDRGVTDFNEEDIDVINATSGDFTKVNDSTYTATITPTSICGDDDNITINIPASSAFDINSNMPNLAAQEVVVNTGVVAVAQNLTVQLAPNGLATISPEDLDNGSGHNCDNGGAVTLSLDRDTFTCSDVGTPVTVTLTATSGNQTDKSTAVVTVENNINSPVAVTKDITVQLNADGMAFISPEQIDNGSGSGCNNTLPILLSLDKSVFTCEDVGMATVVLTARQGSETATATATVTVEEDLDNLVAIAKDITVQLDDNGQVTISPEDVDGGSAYGCYNVPNLSLDIDTFDSDDVGMPVTVTLTATHGNNSDMATATVTVLQKDPPPSSTMMIPTAFTPNGDGANDAWIIDNLSEDASVRIYDRHGTIIFSSDDGYTYPWDGTSRGHSLPAGSYLYLIQNESHTYRGSVTILL
ncbi:gliding motility-associated C-terminal domain-containing protein [Fulvivirgaceae bacterium BMA12]|uniref:Gliding motility-associated C-terminal domain-containing protein n=1 Tax=Agaribacillus aureus TaxID=3051825 RepID=A0ABT8L4X7_9BACT|nr:gliding motility-associated C-terminal domain-containing protein [Fulvivirgaceae bacterium BMA12]